jgi:fumarylacetoacetate (FAA) hydrolase family protein
MASLDLSEEDDAALGPLRRRPRRTRVWRPDVDGPSVAAFREDGVFDVSGMFPTIARSLRGRRRRPRRCARRRERASARLRIFSPTRRATSRLTRPPCACWRRSICRRSRRRASHSPQSLLERVIEERARGRPGRRGEIARRDRAALRRRPERRLKPGSAARRMRLKDGADRGRRVVAISRGRHRPGRRNLHQGAANVGRRRRR